MNPEMTVLQKPSPLREGRATPKRWNGLARGSAGVHEQGKDAKGSTGTRESPNEAAEQETGWVNRGNNIQAHLRDGRRRRAKRPSKVGSAGRDKRDRRCDVREVLASS